MFGLFSKRRKIRSMLEEKRVHEVALLGAKAAAPLAEILEDESEPEGIRSLAFGTLVILEAVPHWLGKTPQDGKRALLVRFGRKADVKRLARWTAQAWDGAAPGVLLEMLEAETAPSGYFNPAAAGDMLVALQTYFTQSDAQARLLACAETVSAKFFRPAADLSSQASAWALGKLSAGLFGRLAQVGSEDALRIQLALQDKLLQVDSGKLADLPARVLKGCIDFGNRTIVMTMKRCAPDGDVRSHSEGPAFLERSPNANANDTGAGLLRDEEALRELGMPGIR
ncbi:MAG: hypothetical protein M5U26_18710 [Planctomycetota bacterium]|nr:hypothetical protein [Planctomycetota bacterium]